MPQQQIFRKAELSGSPSKELLNFLVGLEIISEKHSGPKVEYVITKKGQMICDYFDLNKDNSIFSRTRVFRIK